MSDFMRPEARALLWRWRGVFLAVAIAMLGAFWGLTSFGVLQWLGWVICALGVASTLAALQRLRFNRSNAGPGVVTIDERRVTYLGPQDGGVADLDLLVRLELLPDGPQWRLVSESGTRLDIPCGARGADNLFDVFAALPGIKTEAMLSKLDSPGNEISVIWTAGRLRLH